MSKINLFSQNISEIGIGCLTSLVIKRILIAHFDTYLVLDRKF